VGKLTARSVEGFAKRKGRYSDGDGLFLRVLDPGHRLYWTYRFVVAGRERETSLGAFPDIGLEQARIKHAELRADVLKKIDPLANRQGKTGQPSRPSGKPSFATMANQYIGTHEAGWKSRKHSAQWSATLAAYAASITDTPVDEVDTAAVMNVLAPIWSLKPETANRVRARIETIIDAARALGHIDADKANPARWRGHLDKLLPNPRKVGKPRGHHAAMPYADVPEFMAKLALLDTVASRALAFTILTCARTGEALGARWDEVPFETATWTIPASRMKMGREHQIPLSDAAVAILRAQEAERGSNPHVFPGRPMRPLSGMALAMLLRRMKIDATVHGMRSAARSWMADQGVAFELAEAALAHTVGNAVVQAYQRSSMLERRRPVLASWASYVTAAASNVVQLRAAQ